MESGPCESGSHHQGMKKSRKADIGEMASLVGNAAAHEVLFPGQKYASKEVSLYTGQAVKIALERSWNDMELAEFRQKAIARATSEIRSRTGSVPEESMNVARSFIDKFIEGNLLSDKHGE